MRLRLSDGCGGWGQTPADTQATLGCCWGPTLSTVSRLSRISRQLLDPHADTKREALSRRRQRHDEAATLAGARCADVARGRAGESAGEGEAETRAGWG